MPESFQTRAFNWAKQCFGAEVVADVAVRTHRFLEEALELAQANGCTADEARQLVTYVFERPVGERAQETGGVMVTLAVLSGTTVVDMECAAENELARCWTKIERIRAKSDAKPKFSPLPA